MRKLYLHVGVHRTGTTSTQRSLKDNFAGLLHRGYLHPYGVGRHDDLIRRLRSGALSAAIWAEDLEKRADSHPSPVHSVILSDEDISMIRDMRLFAPLSARFDVKVVVMLRRQDLWLESWYLQNVKWQWDAKLANLSFDDFMARRAEFHWIDYGARLALYADLFGKESVLPGVFERDQMPQGPTAAVMKLMGIADPDFMGPELHINSSLSPRLSEFVRQLPLHRLKEPDRRIFELAANAADRGLASNGSRLMLDHAARAAILAEHEAGNRAVAQDYFGRDTLFGEPLPERDAPLAERGLPEGSEALLADYVVPMIMALGRQITDQRERMEKMAQVLEEVRRQALQASQLRLLPERA